jgi:hypothetical protein
MWLDRSCLTAPNVKIRSIGSSAEIPKWFIVARLLNRHILSDGILIEPAGELGDDIVIVALIYLPVEMEKQVALDADCADGVWRFIFGLGMWTQFSK